MVTFEYKSIVTWSEFDQFLSSVLEDEVGIWEAGVEHGEGELVTVPLSVELLGVFEQIDESVDVFLWKCWVCDHRICLHLSQVTLPDIEHFQTKTIKSTLSSPVVCGCHSGAVSAEQLVVLGQLVP